MFQIIFLILLITVEYDEEEEKKIKCNPSAIGSTL